MKKLCCELLSARIIFNGRLLKGSYHRGFQNGGGIVIFPVEITPEKNSERFVMAFSLLLKMYVEYFSVSLARQFLLGIQKGLSEVCVSPQTDF